LNARTLLIQPSTGANGESDAHCTDGARLSASVGPEGSRTAAIGRGVLVTLLLVGLATLAWYSAWLAANRIYQVDECQNLYMARILATGQAATFFTNGSLFLLGPLSWITRHCLSSEAMFATARLLFLGVFWLNVSLLGRIAGGRVFSVRGLCALAGAATLAPVWDYGVEVRHDNIVLSGMLLIWYLYRARPMGTAAYALAGAIAITALFVAVKALVYVLPLSLFIVAFPPPTCRRPRWQVFLAWAGGALVVGVGIRLCYGSGGSWELYLSAFNGVANYSAGGGSRFWPWFTLQRLLTQTPLLLAMTVAALLGAILAFRKHGRGALSWEGYFPEVFLLGVAMAGLFANPTPFPYNLLHVAPYGFLLSFRYGLALWQQSRLSANAWLLAGGVLVFAHLAPFAVSVERHLAFTNYRQKHLMILAEVFTAAEDPVYDGVGMVLSRPSIDFHWYLHSLNILTFLNGSGPAVRELLAANPAAVLLRNYRTDWLSNEDDAFIREHYVQLADDFLVLGRVLPVGGGGFQITRAGRYRVAALEDSGIAGAQSGIAGTESGVLAQRSAMLDGDFLSGEIVELSLGTHRLERTAGCQPTVVWVGPRLERPPRLGPGAHENLFVNWY
jgi:hypothetical protein